jgi:hypothetical protein
MVTGEKQLNVQITKLKRLVSTGCYPISSGRSCSFLLPIYRQLCSLLLFNCLISWFSHLTLLILHPMRDSCIPNGLTLHQTSVRNLIAKGTISTTHGMLLIAGLYNMFVHARVVFFWEGFNAWMQLNKMV